MSLPYILAGFVFLNCVLIAFVALEAVPHLDDITYRFQARYLSQGAASIPIPPSVEAFNIYLMDSYGDRWFATTFPGWPAVLAVGQILRIELLLSPLFGAACVIFLHKLVSSAFDQGTANLAAILLAVSPWFLGATANTLIHTFSYALILGGWMLLFRSQDKPSIALPVLAGALFGLLFLARPMEGLLMGFATGLWLLSLTKDHVEHWKTVISYSLGCITVGSLVFPYNFHLTGNALHSPLNTYYEKIWGPGSNSLGFGPDRGAVPDWGDVDAFKGHSPLEALLNAHQNLHEVNTSLMGWGGASLAFVLIFFLWGRWSTLSRAMAALCAAVAALYSLYWFYGGYFVGARYWFLMLIPLILFTTLGIATTVRQFERLFPDADCAKRIGFGVAFLCICSMVFWSWMAINRYPGANGYHADYFKMSRQAEFKNALVFIDDATEKEYGSAFWLNDFAENSDMPLFARNLGLESNLEIANAYPERHIFFVTGRSANSPVVTVTRGPLSRAELVE